MRDWSFQGKNTLKQRAQKRRNTTFCYYAKREPVFRLAKKPKNNSFEQ